MRVTVIRTAIIGGGLTYDVYVPLSEVPQHVMDTYPSQTWTHGEKFVDFPAATQSEEHTRMPKGIARYQAWCDHETKARRLMLKIARRAFPELHNLRDRDTLPHLWTTGLMENETSATAELDVCANGSIGCTIGGCFMCRPEPVRA